MNKIIPWSGSHRSSTKTTIKSTARLFDPLKASVAGVVNPPFLHINLNNPCQNYAKTFLKKEIKEK